MDLTKTFESVQQASRELNHVEGAVICRVLTDLADRLEAETDFILAENRKDLERMDPKDPKYDRLKLTRERIASIAADTRNVASLPSPLGIVLERSERPNGLAITKVSVPFGVIGIIYEARPNVTVDVFSLCLKSGNACLLKGGSDADFSNRALIGIIRAVLTKHCLDENTAVLLPAAREAATELMNAVRFVDLIIPRGSQGLIESVRANSKVPVIETGAGICHTYLHEKGDAGKAAAIVNNAKTRRVSVCNALDCLIVDRARLTDLPAVCDPLKESHVVIYADKEAYDALFGHYPGHLLEHATEESFGTEFLDYKMSLKTVDDMDEALRHIARFSSRHSEAIVSEDKNACARFIKSVDAACVYTNASTAFTDGAQFGLGAEIGISTQKMHARGPMALRELTSYKWVIEGSGQIRNS